MRSINSFMQIVSIKFIIQHIAPHVLLNHVKDVAVSLTQTPSSFSLFSFVIKQGPCLFSLFYWQTVVIFFENFNLRSVSFLICIRLQFFFTKKDLSIFFRNWWPSVQFFCCLKRLQIILAFFNKSDFILISIIVLCVIIIIEDLLCWIKGTTIAMRVCKSLKPGKTRLYCSIAVLSLRHHGSW